MFQESLVDDAMARFKERLLEAGRRMEAAKDPFAFYQAEIAIQRLVLEMSDDFTRSILEQMMADGEREKEAVAEVRERATAAKVTLQSQLAQNQPAHQDRARVTVRGS